MSSVGDPHFSIRINGTTVGYYRSSRGVRQGCPQSPYLFTIVMKFFSVMITACARTSLIPTPYVRGDFSVSHLMFADDLIVFSKANPIAADNLRSFLEHFRRFSGLAVNWSKSSIFFSNSFGR